MNKLSSLSIFLPAFNEGENLPIVISKILELAPKIAEKYEVLIINDGSSDNTVEVVNEQVLSYRNEQVLSYRNKITDKSKLVRIINHDKNKGYGAALKTGFYNSQYEYITYMDGDGQFDFSEINKMLDLIDKYDIVVGFRIKRADRPIRIVIGHMWTLLMGVLLGVKLKDIDCGFKLIKRKVLDNIPKLESNGATISAELLAKAKKQGFSITQVGLKHNPRMFGTATGGNPLHIFRAFYDLLLLLPKI